MLSSGRTLQFKPSSYLSKCEAVGGSVIFTLKWALHCSTPSILG